jgi:hypothetical protein
MKEAVKILFFINYHLITLYAMCYAADDADDNGRVANLVKEFVNHVTETVNVIFYYSRFESYFLISCNWAQLLGHVKDCQQLVTTCCCRN